MRGFLLVNPHSGGGSGDEDLVDAAKAHDVHVHLLAEGEDLAELARAADTEVLGIAGGDGSLSAVAKVAVDRDLPFVCIPWGTRNHFAGDVGIDRDDPLAGLSAFSDGIEQRVDVGRLGDRVFLNNVTLGIYARLVHHRERHRRRREALARLRAILLSARERRWTERFVVDGRPLRASVLLVANNEYRLDVFSVGARERLDAGVLAVYAARGLRRLHWTTHTARQVRIETRLSSMWAALDGEPALLESPLELRVEPRALRLLLPRDAKGSARDAAAEEEEQRAQQRDPAGDAGEHVQQVVDAEDHAARGDDRDQSRRGHDDSRAAHSRSG
jgi:diacylglycerol kinase family enzyme